MTHPIAPSLRPLQAESEFSLNTGNEGGLSHAEYPSSLDFQSKDATSRKEDTGIGKKIPPKLCFGLALPRTNNFLG